jgi:hypothetical protein
MAWTFDLLGLSTLHKTKLCMVLYTFQTLDGGVIYLWPKLSTYIAVSLNVIQNRKNNCATKTVEHIPELKSKWNWIGKFWHEIKCVVLRYNFERRAEDHFFSWAQIVIKWNGKFFLFAALQCSKLCLFRRLLNVPNCFYQDNLVLVYFANILLKKNFFFLTKWANKIYLMNFLTVYVHLNNQPVEKTWHEEITHLWCSVGSIFFYKLTIIYYYNTKYKILFRNPTFKFFKIKQMIQWSLYIFCFAWHIISQLNSIKNNEPIMASILCRSLHYSTCRSLSIRIPF